MSDPCQQALLKLSELLAQPESFGVDLVLGKNKHENKPPQQQLSTDLDTTLQTICQHLFEQIEQFTLRHGNLLTKKQRSIKELSGLETLHVVDDVETIWGQVDQQNAALYQLLRKSTTLLEKAPHAIRLLQDIVSSNDEGQDGSDESDDEESQLDSDKDDDEEQVDEDAKRIRDRMARAMADMESDNESEPDMEDDGSDSQSDEDEEDAVPHTQTKRAVGQKDSGEENLVDPAAEELNDGFFDINEMEAFADEEEEYLPDEAYGEEANDDDIKQETDKRSFHQKQRDGDFDAGGVSDDEDEDLSLVVRRETSTRRKKYRADDEVKALFRLYDKPKNADDDDDDIINLTAADIFGHPDKKYRSKSHQSQPKMSQNNKKGDQDDDSWDDYHFDDKKGDVGWGIDGGKGDEDMASEDEFEHDADEDVDESLPMKSILRDKKKGSSGQSSRLIKQTEDLEKEMLSEKPWQMTGEASATARPVNSLLDSTPEFDVAGKLKPVVTVEQTADLEDIIKQRILEEDWDDVQPRELPDVGWHAKRGEVAEVSQEKSKLSLGELYEQEYLKKALGYDVQATEKQSDEDKAKNEMKAMFARLCSKLDALSNYHFAPRPIMDEAEVRPITTPAIAMEEVLPLHVSDARGAAPEEIYGAKRGREGVLRGETEMEQLDRKRLRGSKKTARRKARKQKLADEKLVSRLQPGLGLNNPYEKRKVREELSVARAKGRVTDGEADTNDYGASGTFFARLQAEAGQKIRTQVESGEPDPKSTRSAKSSALKL